jgi:hypothetical protein
MPMNGDDMGELIGIGLYTPAEAARLTRVPAAKIVRWLNGHSMKGQSYNALWKSQVDLRDGHTYLGFRDLMEVKVAAEFIKHGVSAVRIRAAIEVARDVYGYDHPLATDRFKTDGKDIFLTIIDDLNKGPEQEKLLNTFKKQYAFAHIIERSLKGVQFDEKGAPLYWWPLGTKEQIIVDPARSFGQPVDEVSSVPTRVLAAAGVFEGVNAAAKSYEVPPSSVRRAMKFEAGLEKRQAA